MCVNWVDPEHARAEVGGGAQCARGSSASEVYEPNVAAWDKLEKSRKCAALNNRPFIFRCIARRGHSGLAEWSDDVEPK